MVYRSKHRIKLAQVMHDKTYPNLKQFLLLVILYFTLQFILTLIVIMPKVYGWQLFDFYMAFISHVIWPIILIPFILYVSHKSKIPVIWRVKLPPIHFVLLVVILAISTRIIIQPLIIPVEYFSNLVGGKIKLLRFNVPEFDPIMVMKFISAVVLAPIFEEIFWRKQIFGILLKKYSPVASIVLSSFLFACWHVRLNDIGALFIWGLLFCFVYYITNSLELSILLHSVSNLSTFFIVYKYVAMNEVLLFRNIVLIAVCAICVYLVIQYLLQNRLEKKEDEVDDPVSS